MKLKALALGLSASALLFTSSVGFAEGETVTVDKAEFDQLKAAAPVGHHVFAETRHAPLVLGSRSVFEEEM